ncbi:DUF3226 domain-containing protein [Megasphaera sp. DISK 18]|uniref:DUF3226 domain-containing protein n=1 Tax=Megasphaera sp. DISK 18 TaxID=1776081 RepID=UPI000806FBD0|nr:DUF3226 domain-containing protein [Megasphaera sp. DISK 18]OBZ32403.1 hypothetical protein A0U42_10680 [Megasphaera sp. DISK 18]
MPKKREPLKFIPDIPHVILCEGRDEELFLRYYIEYLVERHIVPDTFNIIDLGGNEDLRKKLRKRKFPSSIPFFDNYDRMRGFLIIRDAESDAGGAAQSLQHHMNEAFGIHIQLDGQFVQNPDGIRFGFVLLPGKNAEGDFCDGTLEDLCCQILKENPNEFSGEDLLTLSNSYLDTVEHERGTSLRTAHKNKLHAYFSGTDRFVGLKIGEAARAQCFDFSSPVLDFLKEALIELSSSDET